MAIHNVTSRNHPHHHCLFERQVFGQVFLGKEHLAQSCAINRVAQVEFEGIQQSAHIFSSSKNDFENLSCQFYFEQQTLSYSTEWKDGWSHLELMVRFQSHLFIVSFVNSLHYFPSPHNDLPSVIFTLSNTA